MSNRIGRYFQSVGFRKGDCVALIMDGRPEYVCSWLGLSKIGVVTALVNTTQRGDSLRHSLDIVRAKAVLLGTEYSDVCPEVCEDIPGFRLFAMGGGRTPPGAVSLDQVLPRISAETLSKEIDKQNFKDQLLYIYTSGTTGLPKAAIITNARAVFMGYGVHCMAGIGPEDVLYTPLPLYHTAGGVIGAGAAVLSGATVVIRSKFSASNFWKDCVRYDCTAAQYIGEICRYLLATPPSEDDRRHRVRIMFGNGLRPQIWQEFVTRFRIPTVGEFYGSTEGNANLINIWNKVGSVGYVPWFAKPFYPLKLLKVDPETNEILRDANGRCIRCRQGEPGVLVGDINKKKIVTNFNGYVDKGATEQKILRDVFRKGDSYFNTGDILVEGELGYLYFKDRTGDTFRWRGENISTSEVEAVISNIVGLKDVIVYGVEIPNVEGRAGMAAILDESKSLDWSRLEEGMRRKLSSFARPLFVRILRQLPMTSTFKLKKIDLQKEGYNPNLIQDPLYFFDSKSGTYTRLTPQLYDEIVSNVVRL
ncbi:hypothetical protein AAG570_007331 [Ranatra chinensis]|uniref:Very long-chain fatty acid transport protein n=1 Tax=Ranatra chinensis TaxID=642074 RepID=A0ABD0XY93_9HEMI